MVDRPKLVEFLERRAGDHLRAAGECEGRKADLWYVREDIDCEAITSRFRRIHDNITWSWNPPEEELDETLGAKRASLQIRQHAVIIYLPTADDTGVIIGLEPDAATALNTFVGQCLEYVSQPDSLT